jgi:hypothetical protein
MEEDEMDEASNMRGRDKNAYMLIENRKRQLGRPGNKWDNRK